MNFTLANHLQENANNLTSSIIFLIKPPVAECPVRMLPYHVHLFFGYIGLNGWDLQPAHQGWGLDSRFYALTSIF